MDQALKARLIGAAVLVSLAVLLIPEFLSGRKPAGGEAGVSSASPGTRSFTIELGGGTPAPATGTAPASEPAAVPAQPASVTPAPGHEAGQDTSAVDAAISPPVAAESAGDGIPRDAAPAATRPAPGPVAPSAALKPASGGWAVQVGAFGSAATADKLADQLRSAGFHAYVAPVSRSGKTLNRVRVGPEAERARAEGLATTLKARGLPATVVANE
jgi:DedD protein